MDPVRFFKDLGAQKADFDDDHTKRSGRVHRTRKNLKIIKNAIFGDFVFRVLRGSLQKMAQNGKNRKIVIFLETMDPGGDFGMVIARIGRVVIFWQISKVGGQLGILAKSPVRGVLGSKGAPWTSFQ